MRMNFSNFLNYFSVQMSTSVQIQKNVTKRMEFAKILLDLTRVAASLDTNCKTITYALVSLIVNNLY